MNWNLKLMITHIQDNSFYTLCEISIHETLIYESEESIWVNGKFYETETLIKSNINCPKCIAEYEIRKILLTLESEMNNGK